jgi:hypothetical protein
MKNIYLMFFWLALCFCIIIFAFKVYAEISPQWPFWNHISYYMADKWLKEWKLEEHVKPEPIIKAQNKPVEQRKEEKSIKVAPTVNKELDIKKLAYAVAVAETWDCTKGYWKTHSNCHWIKKGNTYPCTTRPWSKMCVFKDKAESYKAFEIIWMKWYKTFPTHRQAVLWSGNDSSSTWLKHVRIAYAR